MTNRLIELSGGRIDQKNYALIGILLFLAIFTISNILFYFLSNFGGFLIFITWTLVGIAFVVWWIFTVRRLHDMGKSPLFSLILLIPIVNIAFSFGLMIAKSEALVNKHGIPVPPGTPFFEVLNRNFNERGVLTTRTRQNDR